MFFEGKFLPRVRRAGLWLFLPALAVVAWGELTPHPPPIADEVFGWDKAEHFTAYFGLALLASLAWGLRRSVLLVLVGVIALGGVLEILQSFAGRDAEWLDELANSLGAAAGTALACGYLAIPRRLVGGSKRD
jgi:VanZ family protein